MASNLGAAGPKHPQSILWDWIKWNDTLFSSVLLPIKSKWYHVLSWSATDISPLETNGRVQIGRYRCQNVVICVTVLILFAFQLGCCRGDTAPNPSQQPFSQLFPQFPSLDNPEGGGGKHLQLLTFINEFFFCQEGKKKFIATFPLPPAGNCKPIVSCPPPSRRSLSPPFSFCHSPRAEGHCEKLTLGYGCNQDWFDLIWLWETEQEKIELGKTTGKLPKRCRITNQTARTNFVSGCFLIYEDNVELDATSLQNQYVDIEEVQCVC